MYRIHLIKIRLKKWAKKTKFTVYTTTGSTKDFTSQANFKKISSTYHYKIVDLIEMYSYTEFTKISKFLRENPNEIESWINGKKNMQYLLEKAKEFFYFQGKTRIGKTRKNDRRIHKREKIMQNSTKLSLMEFIGNHGDINVFPRFPEKITIAVMDALLLDIKQKIEVWWFGVFDHKTITHLHKCSAELRLIDDCSSELIYGAKCIQSQAFSREKTENKLKPEGISFTDGVRSLYIFRNEHDQSLVCPDVCKLSVDILKQKLLG